MNAKEILNQVEKDLYGHQTVRKEVLDQAINCVCRDRQDQHGKPENVFETIAQFWNSYLDSQGFPSGLAAHDVSWMMVLLKVARASANPKNIDNGVDAAGYAALAVELSTTK